MTTPIVRACWCGNADLSPFEADYDLCEICGTLVTKKGLPPEKFQVVDDDIDFYGKQYWLKHQEQELGSPDIHTRARTDLTERNLHWLHALLKFCLPPAKVVELGCAHGGFVSLLRLAGFDASGTEMSPWVVEFGKKTFNVPIAVGPIEGQGIPPGSLDVIALMDVLEHLSDPATTMANCLRLLKPGGLLLVQTPQFREGTTYAEMVETNSRFLEMLIPEEHIYLFSDRSATRLFQQLGADHLQFEPAIFSHYDMFFAASPAALRMNTTEQVDAALLASPHGRIILGLLDLQKRELDLTLKLEQLGSDQLARGEQIDTLTVALNVSESDRAARAGQIESLTKTLNESESDRVARGSQIESLTATLNESEADRAARAAQIESLSAKLNESDADRAARGSQIESLTTTLNESDADRVARGSQIEQLTTMLNESETDRAARGSQIESLTAMLKESEADRAARASQIESLTAMLKNSQADRSEYATRIETIAATLAETEASRVAHARQVELMAATLEQSEADRARYATQLELFQTDLRALFARRGFRWITRFIGWPEVEKLAGRAGKSGE